MQCQVSNRQQSVLCHSFIGHLLASRPNEILVIDFTVLEVSWTGIENVLVMTDVSMKYNLAGPTRDQRAETVAGVLVAEWFYKLGVLAHIHSDQGHNFESRLMQQLCSLYRIEKSLHLNIWLVKASVNGLTVLCIIFCMPFLLRGNDIGYPVFHLYCSAIIPHPTRPLVSLEPQLPVDFLLRRVQDVMPGSVHEWIVEHQARLQVTFEGAHELLKISIDRQSAGSVRFCGIL